MSQGGGAGADIGGANEACPSIICLLFTGSPQHQFWVRGAKKLMLFYLENKVYLVNDAFASANLEKISHRNGIKSNFEGRIFFQNKPFELL